MYVSCESKYVLYCISNSKFYYNNISYREIIVIVIWYLLNIILILILPNSTLEYNFPNLRNTTLTAPGELVPPKHGRQELTHCRRYGWKEKETDSLTTTLP